MVESEKKFIIELKFNTFDDLESFEKAFRSYKEGLNGSGINKPVEMIEPKIENRGKKTKEMHQKIKEYLKDHPNEKYKEVLKKYKTI